ncbi:MAG: Na+/H+ antiporter NhaC [Ruminococcus sp.]|nr:Na+/H+ antiporter NhaC [Ruminococcus sp.]
MEENKIEKTIKTPSLGLAVLPLIFMFVVLFTGLIIFKVDIKVLLLLCAAFTIVLCMYLGHTWKDVENEIVDKLAKAFPAIMILITVGLMIGAWIVSGTIPFLVYIGLKIINPRFIIVTSFLVTVILSVSTGTSWGAAGTVGAALMSVAAGMGAPLPAVAGAIVAGAYFGDKMSPLSDSTNMSAIATNTNLYKHIGHMFYTTVPGFLVSCVVYIIAGISFASSGEIGQVDEIIKTLSELFNLSMPVGLLLLVPPVIVIYGSLRKKPTIPVMFISSAVAVLIAMFFIGALTIAGCLDVILSQIMKHIHSTGQLITVTAVLGVIIITVIGEASVTFLMIGGLFKDEYIKRGLQTKNLSRTLEDSITVVEPLVPWSLAGVYMTSTLGVPTAQYAPWACLCYTGVIFAIIWGFTGFGIAKIQKGGDNYEDYVELTGNELES